MDSRAAKRLKAEIDQLNVELQDLRSDKMRYTKLLGS